MNLDVWRRARWGTPLWWSMTLPIAMFGALCAVGVGPLWPQPGAVAALAGLIASGLIVLAQVLRIPALGAPVELALADDAARRRLALAAAVIALVLLAAVGLAAAVHAATTGNVTALFAAIGIGMLVVIVIVALVRSRRA